MNATFLMQCFILHLALHKRNENIIFDNNNTVIIKINNNVKHTRNAYFSTPAQKEESVCQITHKKLQIIQFCSKPLLSLWLRVLVRHMERCGLRSATLPTRSITDVVMRVEDYSL